MLTYRNLCTLCLLLLLPVRESAMILNLFRRLPEPQDGEVRLFSSGSDSEGRVEVYHEGKWGTVCDDGWDMAEAQVVCRQLRFPGAKSVVTGKDYGQVSGPIWLDDMECKGSESHLFNCGFKAWGVTDCSHKEDVGVICETASMYLNSYTNMTMGNSTHSLDHSIGLSDELGQIFDSGNHCDFLISVQSATGNRQEDGTMEMVGTTICAHKMILSRFPLFGVTEENSSIVVNISQTCQPYFTSFIRYIYTRKIDVTFYTAQCLHRMASKFGVKQLMEETGRLFTKILPEDTSFHTQVSLYEYAEETEDFILQENCIQYLAWNYEILTTSPTWTRLSAKLLGALLIRSDLVVPDEYFLLQTVENWIMEKGNSSLETQADLLGRIRFPMIPAEKLHDLESSSSLYSTHKNIFWENMLKAFQFNVLLFSNIKSSPKFIREDDDYKSRIYTAEPWSTVYVPSKNPQSNPVQPRYISYNNRRRYAYYPTVSPYSQTMIKSFSTPIHNSLIFKDNKIPWEASILTNKRECSNQGLRCESFPAARLSPQYHYTQQSNVLFHNRFLLMCQDRFICQVQDFKANLAYITANGTHAAAYPCPDDQYTYRFVVRPEYV
ncbi:galectin-3-binding protein A-like [Pempheris klunzingeri]|uniref:galectin-3-binding protein A-like n=1 Tax=Pempheris klunzingeri TaxID=3127111 RepID=UPI0039811700